LILFTKIKNWINKPAGSARNDQEGYLSGLSRLLKYAVIVQAAVWAIYFLQLHFAGEGGRAAVNMFLSGPRAYPFWVFQVVVGLALPFVLLFHKSLRKIAALRFLGALGAIVGAFFGVVNIFIGGQLLPMTSPVWEKVPSEPGKVVFAAIMIVLMLVVFLISYKLLPYENHQTVEA
jgi:Ni/Fe-hydrogenase subunit HybB-like protein